MGARPTARLSDENCLVVVLGDFGRDATFRFCTTLARLERELLLSRLESDAEFFDEYRRMQLVVQGQLAFVKEPYLRPFRDAGKALDSSVLVGFEGGLSPDQVEPRLGVLALEAMAGPLRRGVRDVLVLLPCNTLAEVSMALADRFSSQVGLQDMLDEAGLGAGDLELPRLITEARISFPTVPEAVLLYARQQMFENVLPLGTLKIAATYRRVAHRLGLKTAVLESSRQEQIVVLSAIEAAIGGKHAPRARAGEALRRLHSRRTADRAGDLLLVEACTDLDYGVGIDSNAAYARHAVELVYGS